MAERQNNENADAQTNRRPVINTVDILDDKNLLINGHQYQIVSNVRDAFDREQLADRFSPVLSKYNFIVGDIGYEQLRLKGFYADQDRNAKAEEKQSAIEDYLLEYCNYGCAYFVLKNLNVNKTAKQRSMKTRAVNERGKNASTKAKHVRKRTHKVKQKAYTQEKITSVKPNSVKKRQNKVTEVHKRGKRSFTIRETK
ncbi:YutD family protein [Pediococcus siamensis]|uniref:YutD family protein n=1 Tax=Pediococcus siamensis TaxID=381829 RepID=UPI0039A35F2D